MDKNQDMPPLCRPLCFILMLSVLLPVRALALTPDDPLAMQWSYEETKVPEAWDITTGSSAVVVAIIDNGFDMYHPELYENTWRNTDEIGDNRIDDDRNGYIDDVWGWNFVPEDKNGDQEYTGDELLGNNDPRPSVVVNGVSDPELTLSVHHATLVAGLIGAIGNNGQNGAGIAWNVRLMNIKVVGNTGVGEITNLDQAIRYAVDNGAHVINFSLVTSENIPAVEEAIRYAYSRGVAMVAAVGNDTQDLSIVPKYPACVDTRGGEQLILGVSAITQTRHLAMFSNFGPCVDLTGPGVSISSTMRYAPQYGLISTYGSGWNGTSFSAPFVTGAAALVKAIQPSWGAKDIYRVLLQSYRKPPPVGDTEYANLFGVGLIQVNKAVQFALDEKPLERALDSIVFVGNSGGAEELVVDTTTVGPYPFASLGQFYDLASYQSPTERYVATITANTTKRNNTVRVYDATWHRIQEWVVPVNGTFRLVFINNGEGKSPSLVIVPAGRSQELYRVYSLEGKLVTRVTGKTWHTGVSVATGNIIENQGTFVLMSGSAKEQRIRHLTSAGRELGTFVVPDAHVPGNLRMADVTGDGTSEYVVAGGNGDAPLVRFMAADGTVLRQFFAYDPSYRKGVGLLTGDYDHDGAEDVGTFVADGTAPVRMWSGRTKRIAEQPVLTSKKTSSVWAIPLLRYGVARQSAISTHP